MTGTDPAILAAQRAWESEGWGGPGRPLEEGMSEGRLAVAAVREAFASIRELHKRRRSPGRTSGATTLLRTSPGAITATVSGPATPPASSTPARN